MKNQALFSSKDRSKKLKCCLLQFLIGALRVKLNSKISGPCLTYQYRFSKTQFSEILVLVHDMQVVSIFLLIKYPCIFIQ